MQRLNINRSFTSLVLVFTATHLLGMNQSQALIGFNIIPEVRDHIIYDLFPVSFNKNNKPELIRKTIVSLHCVSKDEKLSQFINSREVTQTIINSVSQQQNQDYWARKIGTPGMMRYLKKNSLLHRHIHCMRPNRINRFLAQGADVNYFPAHKMPLLFRTLNYPLSAETLLNNGANINVVYQKKTALQTAIENENFNTSELLLSYNPQDKCLPIAVFGQNQSIIDLIMIQNDIPQDQLNESLQIAQQMNDNAVTIFNLVTAGAKLGTTNNKKINVAEK